jgi:molybdate transport system substrate-binding protein
MRRDQMITLLLCLATQGAAAFAAETEPPITVFAAASLTDVLPDIANAYQKAGGTTVRFSFAASSMLARQIQAGARADIFFSADTEWMDYLQARNLIQKLSRRDVVGNELVLVAPADSKLELKIAANFPIIAALGKGRLATGDPDSVPVGRYARSALTTLGVWSEIADRLVRADNVRTALMFVARGEAPLGIVYTTDALAEPKVRIVDTFPASSHLPITYPVALVTNAKAGATAFVAYLVGKDARAIFRKHGFQELAP